MGEQGVLYLDDMYYFEPETRNWTQIFTDGPGGRDSFGFTGYNGSLFLFGGRDPLRVLVSLPLQRPG